MEYLFIYCLQIFDTLHILKFIFGFCIVVCIVFWGACWAFLAEQYDFKKAKNEIEPFLKGIKKFFIIFSILLFLVCLIPTKQTLLLMGGTYLGKKVISSEKLKKVNTIIDLQLDKYIKELK